MIFSIDIILKFENNWGNGVPPHDQLFRIIHHWGWGFHSEVGGVMPDVPGGKALRDGPSLGAVRHAEAREARRPLELELLLGPGAAHAHL